MANEHGSPYDRGSADAYYRRLPVPHKSVSFEIDGRTFYRNEYALSQEELQEYYRGFNFEFDRKNFYHKEDYK